MNTPEIQGHVHPRYTRVRDVFAEQFSSAREIGAAVAIVLDGEPVVDLFAGHADPARTRPWTLDTITHVYSVTKGMTALCAHRLLESGALELDVPVARYWPEFAQAGKAGISVRWLLSHRAGLQALTQALPADVPGTRGGRTLYRARPSGLPPCHLRLAGRRVGAADRRA
jgi:CubicO group peptidase (beta-lactamase class C family)